MNPIKQQKLDLELRRAVADGNIPAIKMALAQGAHPGILADNPFVPGEQRLPAFFWSVMSGNLAVVRQLLEMGFDPNVLDENGKTALFHVPRGPEGKETWDFLVGLGLDPDKPDDNGALAWERQPPPPDSSGPVRTWKAPRPTLGPTRLPDEEDE